MNDKNAGAASAQRLTIEQQLALLSGADLHHTVAIEEAGVAAVAVCDGPHGLRVPGPDGQLPATCFPPAVAVASSWDPDVARSIGAALGVEARAQGVAVSLGPGLNIKRSPLCGRNFEYYSEDPLLSGQMATAHVLGIQRQGVGACPKHFAANNQETGRMTVDVDVDERTLREIYLPAFEQVVTDARPATIMGSYNKLGGTYACEHPWLLQTVLREEWGFEGLVLSDWGAVEDRVAALKAGCDLEMPASNGISEQELVQALDTGRLDPAVVTRSAQRVLDLQRWHQPATGTMPVDEHHRLAQTLAAQCAVLLKNNDDVLPLPGGIKLAVVGVLAQTPRYQGAGSSQVLPTVLESPLDALREQARFRDQTLVFADGYTIETASVEEEQGLLAEAVAIAAAADVTVVFAGLPASEESEGFDRTSLELPQQQVRLIRAVAKSSRRTVVVLQHGGVVTMEPWVDEVHAILDCFLLGQGVAGATAALLNGDVTPSGRLAETVPLRLQDTPCYLSFPGDEKQVRYAEGVMVGYRHYTSAEQQVRFPFGHGLSYTTFDTGEPVLRVTGPDSAELDLAVMNTGSRTGAYVVQVYVGAESSPVRRPLRELRAFTKVPLRPGESAPVTVTLSRRAFAFWDIEASQWRVPAGRYRVEVCADAQTVLHVLEADLAGDPDHERLTVHSTAQQWFHHPLAGPRVRALLESRGPAGRHAKLLLSEEMLYIFASIPMHRLARVPGVPLTVEDLATIAEGL